MFLHQSTLELLTNKGNSQSIWFVNYSALEKMDSLDAMEGDAAGRAQAGGGGGTVCSVCSCGLQVTLSWSGRRPPCE